MKGILLIAVSALTLTAVSASAADAKEIWKQTCAKCHGMEGKGDTKIGKKLEVKDFTDAKVQASLKDEEMLKAIKEGIHDGDKLKMKPAEGIDDAGAKALVAHVRSLKR